MGELTQAVLQGDRRALARLISLVEDDTAQGRQALDVLFAKSGKAHVVGVTGASGAGKSSLVNCLVDTMLKQEPEKRVAVIAVDPTSPFSGGAVLGDRIRMRAIAENPNVFIRSMASRGALGGLAHNTQAVALALDAAGYDLIVIESVGAGQSEVEIASLAHSVIVVEAPGLGDDVQAAKAGIMEIADILVLNKADKADVDVAEMALRSALAMGYSAAEADTSRWVPPILRTVATDGEGISEVVKTLHAHAAFLKRSGDWQQRDQARLRAFLRGLLERSREREWQQLMQKKENQGVMEQVFKRKLSPFAAIEQFEGRSILKN
ncbi:MAG TPA: methylmalonyl Co-A mutase-associated GTPase MeaB [Anaerolineaceae bacterium]|nr:methylmalonyl Co-A mutase-associated GTPase MeaB [Anaerolineaceae bacterium]